MILELLGRDVEALDELLRPGWSRAPRRRSGPADGQGATGGRRSARARPGRRGARAARPPAVLAAAAACVGSPSWRSSTRSRPSLDLVDELRRRERPRAALLAQHPARQQVEPRVGRREDAVRRPRRARPSARPTRRCPRRARPRPRPSTSPNCQCCRPAELGRVEVLGQAEVALAPGGEADVAAIRETRKVRTSPRSRSRPIRYQEPASGRRAYGLTVRSRLRVARDRPVREPDRALLRDGAFELGQASRHLRRSSRGRAARRAPRSRGAASSSVGRPSARFWRASRSGSE